MGPHLDPLPARFRGGGIEDQVDVLARADLVLDVGRRAMLLAGHPPLRAGMSAVIEIDTGYHRPLPDLVTSLLAWIGVILLGYVAGPIYSRAIDSAKRIRMLDLLGVMIATAKIERERTEIASHRSTASISLCSR